MKLSEMRPCDCCGGPVMPHVPLFHVFHYEHLVLKADEVRRVDGILAQWGKTLMTATKHELSVAETFVGGDVTEVFTEERDVRCCMECAMPLLGILQQVVERRDRLQEKEKADVVG